MKSSLLYWIGTLVLFLGLFWMFLPHAAHGAVTGEAEQETEHYIHLIQGLLGTLIGLGILKYEQTKR